MKKISEIAGWVGIGHKGRKYKMCDFCNGSGKIGKKTCEGCDGFGVMPITAPHY